jgi:hypothetical protein
VLQVIDLNDNRVLVDNVGSFDVNGVVSFVGLQIDSITGGQTTVKISVLPANQSAITPQRNDVLNYDESRSQTTGIITTATN